MSILIKDCSLIDDTTPQGYVTGQNVLVEGDAISRLTSDSISEEGVETVLNGRDRLAIPGLVNAHTHSPENFPRATKERLPLELWLNDLFLLGEFSPREIYLATVMGALQMLKTGTTAVLDNFWMGGGFSAEGLDAVMQAYADTGMRAGVAPMFEDIDDKVMRAAIAAKPQLQPLLPDDREVVTAREYIELLEWFFAKWHRAQDGRLLCLAGPAGFEWCSDELLEDSLDLARRHGAGFHMHLAETKLQAMVCHDLYGKSPASAMKEHGLVGPDVSFAHSVWLDDADVDMLGETNTRVVHNPASNLRLGSGFAPVIEMLERGIAVGIGTDGAASNDNQIMFDVMKLTGLIHNVRSRDHRRWPSSRDVMRMATVNGAAALGLGDDLGQLKPGKLADISLLDTSTPLLTPLNDAFLQLMCVENGSSVRTVIVDGKVVVEDGIVLSVDEESILAEAAEVWTRLYEKLPPLRKEFQPLLSELEQYQQDMINRDFYIDRY
jgi:cytosine/adenosine deaminase-related metal-dependent hydrolase